MSEKVPSAETPAAEHELPYHAELKRKALHLLALVVPLGMMLLGRMGSLLVLVPAALLALGADVLRARSQRFAELIRRIFGPLMRMDELPPPGAPVSVNGATWVLLSAALLTILFPLRLVVPVFVMSMISDAAAALVGRRFGRVHWGHGPRTVEGSAAFLISGLAVMAFFPSIPFWIGAGGVAVACLAEALPRPLNDNLRVPLVAAAFISLLEWLFLGRSIELFF